MQTCSTSRDRHPVNARGEAGMTLTEVVVALAISALAVGAVFNGYNYSVTTADKASLSLAAQAKAMERLEQTRCAQWDTTAWPVVDKLLATNFPNQVVTLDLNKTGAGVTTATNITQITQISTTPPLRRIHVDCIWRFRGKQLITNSVETCRAPDQ